MPNNFVDKEKEAKLSVNTSGVATHWLLWLSQGQHVPGGGKI